VTKWISQPPGWQNLDNVQHIIETAPQMANFYPTNADEMSIYTRKVEAEVTVRDAYRRGEITTTDKNKIMDSIEEQFVQRMIDQGRTDELAYADLWPIERLSFAGLLNPQLEYMQFGTGSERRSLVSIIRFIREDLAANDGVGPDSTRGREMLPPLYNTIIARALEDPDLAGVLTELGLALYKQTEWDDILPKFLADDWAFN
jgi:hypothetical protein